MPVAVATSNIVALPSALQDNPLRGTQDNGGEEEEEKKEANVQMHEEADKDEASDQENYYLPSTVSTPNVIGNAHVMMED